MESLPTKGQIPFLRTARYSSNLKARKYSSATSSSSRSSNTFAVDTNGILEDRFADQYRFAHALALVHMCYVQDVAAFTESSIIPVEPCAQAFVHSALG